MDITSPQSITPPSPAAKLPRAHKKVLSDLRKLKVKHSKREAVLDKVVVAAAKRKDAADKSYHNASCQYNSVMKDHICIYERALSEARKVVGLSAIRNFMEE